jgi:carbon storage regulator
MLVLSRKRHERLIIGENIIVTIVKIAGGTVRIGIEAPPDVQIQREEVRDRDTEARQELLAHVA